MNILQVTTCRPELFWRMLASLDGAKQLRTWHLQVHAQAWPAHDEELLRYWIMGSQQSRKMLATSVKESLWQSRVWALNGMSRGDVLCFADDDMIFGPETDYDTPAAFIRANPHVGCVATQMKRRRTDPSPPLLRVYSEQHLPGVMGGMLIGYEAAQDVLKFGDLDADYRPDDVHISGACYIAGRSNCMYHGSCTVHEWGAPGGIIDVQRANPWMHAGHQEYFELNLRKKYIFGQQWKLELTQKAHDEHKANAGRWL